MWGPTKAEWNMLIGLLVLIGVIIGAGVVGLIWWLS